ncbi:hypothetical protein [Bdellovibrio sp.]|uniref:hypothetical protein n=1 Tax=Bdellovibrio sp. TaxID=28201 RepID=UPI002F354831
MEYDACSLMLLFCCLSLESSSQSQHPKKTMEQKTTKKLTHTLVSRATPSAAKAQNLASERGFSLATAKYGLCRRHDGANHDEVVAATEPGWRAERSS